MKVLFFLPFVCHLFENVSMLPIYTLQQDLKLQNWRYMIFAEARVGSLLMKTVCFFLVKFS